MAPKSLKTTHSRRQAKSSEVTTVANTIDVEVHYAVSEDEHEEHPQKQPRLAQSATPQEPQQSKLRKTTPRRNSKQRPAASPDLFPDGMTDYAASNRLIWESANILTQGSDLPWESSETGEGCYKSVVAKGKGYISFWLTDDLYTNDPSALERDLAITLIEQFDLRATCLHLIYAAHATQLNRPWEDVDSGNYGSQTEEKFRKLWQSNSLCIGGLSGVKWAG